MRQMRQAGRHVTLRLGTRGDYGTAIGAAHIISYNGWRVPRLEQLLLIPADQTRGGIFAKMRP